MALLVAFLLLALMRSGMSQLNNTENNTNRPLGSFCGRNAPIVLSNFINNRNITLSEIRRQLSSNNVFYARAQSLAEGDSVFGAAQCRNYLSTAQCVACFDAGVSELASCLTGNGAYVFFDNCFLRYENYDRFYNDPTTVEDAGIAPRTLCGNQSANQSATTFTQSVQGLLADIRDATPRTSNYYVASTRQITSTNATMYAIAQCVQGTSQAICRNCISTAYTNINTCLPSTEGRSINMGCFARYSEAPFFNDNQTIDITNLLKGSSSKVPVIAGAIGGVGLLFIMIVIWLMFRLRKKSKKMEEDSEDMNRAINYQYKDLQVATNNFSNENLLGKGGFGEVFKAILDDKSIVAVKKIEVEHLKGKKEFENEVKLISNVQHRNLLRLLGWSSEGSHRLLVLEYMSNGSLDRFLWGAKRGTLNWKQRYDIIFGIARGLAHLHNEFHVKIIHRDIKSGNILLDHDFQPKIADFGLARLQAEDKSHISTKFAGTLGYTAPEYVLRGLLSDKVDTYSFGIVILEIISGRRCNDVNTDRPSMDYLLEHSSKIMDTSDIRMEWYIRAAGDKFNHDWVYDKLPHIFSLKIHHGGVFTKGGSRSYVDGRVSYVDCVDGDQFSVIELNAMLKELGYVKKVPMWYHFMAPDSDLDFGLYPLTTDRDVRFLLTYVSKYKLIEVYVELWKTNLQTYIRRTPQSERKKFGEVGQCSGQNAMPEPPPTTVRKKLFAETGQGSGQCESAPTADDFFSDVYFNEAGMAVGVETQVGEGSDTGSDSGEDTDFVEDDEHRIQEVEVDMADFRNNVDDNVEWLPNREDVPDRVIDDDIDIGQVNFDNIDSDCEDDSQVKGLQSLRKEHNTNPVNKVHFFPGQVFGSKLEVKELVTRLAVETRRQLKIVKNDKSRFTVICKGKIPVFTKEHASQHHASQKSNLSGKSVGPSESVGPKESDGPCSQSSHIGKGVKPIYSPQGVRWVKKKKEEVVKEQHTGEVCNWMLHVSKPIRDDSWVVKTYKDTHNCLQARVLKNCTSQFLSKEIEENLHPSSKLRTTHLRDQLQSKLEISFSRYKVYRAQRKAKERLMGSYEHQYQILRDYIMELQSTNPGTTVKLDFEPDSNPDSQTRVFRRIYVCLGGLKQGFKAGGRDLLGLDGAFLKIGTGQLLTAVGVDPNNGIYPLAYGIVESENKASWLWFLEHLADDLELNHMSNFTFISDRQKGIIPAITQLFPCAEHRFCLKHIYENMKLTYRGQLYKDFLWKAATATTVMEFNKVMQDLKKVNNGAYEWLKEIPPRHWSRSHFLGRSHCDVLLNNMCESFNSKLVDAREKPIVTCLEFVREYLMKRNAKIQKMIVECPGPLTPNATIMFDGIKKEAAKYKATWNGKTQFQVTGPWMDQCVVDMAEKTCSCRKWEISGMPCKHAVAVFWNMGENQQEVGIPESYVHPAYWLHTWKTMYSFAVGPTKGRAYWPTSECTVRILPPKHKVSIGRPKKKRRMSQSEIQLVKEGKLTRALERKHCGNCKEDGHNKRTCPKVPQQQGSQSTSTVGGSKVAGSSGKKTVGSKKA